MKKLLTISPGNTTTMLVYTRSKSSVSRGNKPFLPHYGQFGYDVSHYPPEWLTFATSLKDGSFHVYYYPSKPPNGDNPNRANICNGEQNINVSRKFGGEFYNPNVRPSLVSKDVFPT